MTRKRKRGLDAPRCEQLIDICERIIHAAPPRNDDERDLIRRGIEVVRQGMQRALNIRPKYQRHIPRLINLWTRTLSESGRPATRAAVDDGVGFATSAAFTMQRLEDEHGAFPVAVRWAVYRAFADMSATALAEDDGTTYALDVLKSRRLNHQKRQKRRHDMTLDERDAAIVEEWRALEKEMPGRGHRDDHLAEKYGLDCGRSVFNIRKKAGVR